MKKALLLVSILFISVVSTACINNFAVQELNNKAKAFIDQFVLCNVPVKQLHNADYKTMLQELVQQRKNQVLTYRLIGESGPDHNKLFAVCVFLNDREVGRGEGTSKKRAEQQAAQAAIEKLFPEKA